MSKFNWQMATVGELVRYILDKSNDNVVRQQINYYKKMGNKVMLERIDIAKKMVKRSALKEALFKIDKELGLSPDE
jgi:hypothetical protein